MFRDCGSKFITPEYRKVIDHRGENSDVSLSKARDMSKMRHLETRGNLSGP